MTESNETNARPEPTVRADAGLAPRLDRMRTLRSAFAALAPSALTDQGRALSQAGRALTQRLAARAEAGTATPAAELARLDADLDAFERAMRELALALPVAQLRSTLPGRIGRDRRSVLDLLDLLLSDGDASDEDRAATRRLAKAGDIIGIPLLDHVIVCETGYLSMKEEGYLR